MSKNWFIIIVVAFCLCSCYGFCAGGADECRQAAERGDPSAQNNLGLCYLNGDGVGKDQNEAVKWFRIAAEQGDAEGQYMLGACYANGIGVIENKAEATKWWLKSAEKGNAKSQYVLWICYATGTGVTKDKVEAVKWYRKVMENNNEELKQGAKAMVSMYRSELPCD